MTEMIRIVTKYMLQTNDANIANEDEAYSNPSNNDDNDDCDNANEYKVNENSAISNNGEPSGVTAESKTNEENDDDECSIRGISRLRWKIRLVV